MTTPITPDVAIERAEHGDWLIWHDPLPIEARDADWQFCRKIVRNECDYGRGASREDCLQTIDWLEGQDAEDAAGGPERSPEADALLARFRNIDLIRQLGGGLNAAKSILAANGRGFADSVLRTQMDAAIEAFEGWNNDRDA